jgi:hypothetical protein
VVLGVWRGFPGGELGGIAVPARRVQLRAGIRPELPDRRRGGATTASSVTYLTPLSAAVVGVSLLGEQLTWNQPVGAVVVLTGVALAQGRLRALRRAAAAPDDASSRNRERATEAGAAEPERRPHQSQS